MQIQVQVFGPSLSVYVTIRLNIVTVSNLRTLSKPEKNTVTIFFSQKPLYLDHLNELKAKFIWYLLENQKSEKSFVATALSKQIVQIVEKNLTSSIS